MRAVAEPENLKTQRFKPVQKHAHTHTHTHTLSHTHTHTQHSVEHTAALFASAGRTSIQYDPRKGPPSQLFKYLLLLWGVRYSNRKYSIRKRGSWGNQSFVLGLNIWDSRDGGPTGNWESVIFPNFVLNATMRSAKPADEIREGYIGIDMTNTTPYRNVQLLYIMHT
jgi:hypothetical protein